MARHNVANVSSRIIASFVPYQPWRSAVRNFVYNKISSCDAPKDQRVRLAVCAIMRNEGRFLREWIELHRLVGVEKFYLYDNESTDNTQEILKPYIESGIVECTIFPGKRVQVPAYKDCLARHSHDTEWLAIIDLDEFIAPVKYKNLLRLLDTVPADVAMVKLYWVLFGSNGHEKRPDGLVIENYTRRDEPSKTDLYKSVVRPDMIDEPDIHWCYTKHKAMDIPRNVARIHHYHCKSWEDYKMRVIRGCGSDTKDPADRYTREFFDHHNHNDVEDKTLLKYLHKLKRKLKRQSKGVL